MVATSAHHVVRVTVRIDVASFHRDVDLTLPTSSSFAEILPEIAQLVDLPEVSRPWEATTAAGAVLDPLRPLYQQRLHDGQVVVLRPLEPTPPPVVRGAAESLAATSGESSMTRGLDTAASLAGAVMAAIATTALAGPVAALAVAAAALCAVGAVARSRVLLTVAVVAAAAAAGAWVAGPREGWAGAPDPALGALAAALVLAAAAGAGVALKLLDAPATAFLATIAALAAVGAAAAWLPTAVAPAAAAVVAGLAAVMLTPGVATRAAGISIPRVPTAGEDFAVADDYQADVDERGRVARRITAGIALGVAVCTVPALLWLGAQGGAWTYAFTLCVAGALVIHAFRHRSAVPRASLALTASAAVVASVVVVAATGDPHPAWLAGAFFTAGLALTAVLWAPRVPDLEPTTLVWLERAELVALIAVFPLGFHLAGVFDLIRGV